MVANLAVIILGAGKGTRMQSAMPKVLHEIAGRTMLGHVQATADELNPQRCLTVLGPEAEAFEVAGEVVIQKHRRGTGHAVQVACSHLDSFDGWILVLYGDSPLVRASFLKQMLTRAEAETADLVVSGFRSGDPSTYGRLVVQGGKLERIVEFKDATEKERTINFCNGGIMALRAPQCVHLLDQLTTQNAAAELYLTDIVGLMSQQGSLCIAVEADETDLKGVNTREELSEAEAVMQKRLRSTHMDAGVTMIDPGSVKLSYDTKIGVDTVLEPNQVIGPGVTIGTRAIIRGFCHLEETEISDGASIGPFARLRPGTKVGPKVRVGNFVETKNADFGEGSKVNHLSYVGDAKIGSFANIGAGTITCNYDGFSKHQTEIGDRAFIGSNTALVAPISIGEGAIVGAGSTLTKDVPPNSLTVTRGPIKSVQGGAVALRQRLVKHKKETKK